MTPGVRKTVDDDLRRSDWKESDPVHLEPYDLRVGSDVQLVVAPRDGAAAKARAEVLLLVEAPITVRVAQRDHGASGRLVVVKFHIQIAVWSNGHVACRAEVVGHYRGTEAGGEGETAIVWIARPGTGEMPRGEQCRTCRKHGDQHRRRKAR